MDRLQTDLRSNTVRLGALLVVVGSIAGCPCSRDGGDPRVEVGPLAGIYVGTYAGGESGPAGCTVQADGRLEAWADSPSAGRFRGSGAVDPSGNAKFAVAGTGVAAGFKISFEGRFSTADGTRRGAGTWQSSSGNSGSWQVAGGRVDLATDAGADAAGGTAGEKVDGGATTEAGPPGNADVLPTRQTVISLADDVPPAVRERIRSYGSLVQTSPGVGPLLVNARGMPIVFALDASNEPLLSGIDNGGRVVLGMQSTALATVAPAAQTPLSSAVDVAQWQALVLSSPDFPALHATIVAAVTSGRSYLDDQSVIQAAAPLARLVMEGFPPPLRRLIKGQGHLAAAGSPVAIELRGSQIVFRNETFIHYGTKVSGAQGSERKRLQARSYDLGGDNRFDKFPEVTHEVGDGRYELWVGQDGESKRFNTVRYLSEFIQLVAKVAIGEGIKESSLTMLLEKAVDPAKVLEFEAAKDQVEVANIAANIILPLLPLMLDELIEDALKRGATKTVGRLLLRKALGVLHLAYVAWDAADKLSFFAHYAGYRGHQETRITCVESQSYVQCIASITPDPAFLRLEKGKFAPVTTTFVVDANAEYSRPRFKWTVPSFASLAGNDDSINLVRAVDVGEGAGTISVPSQLVSANFALKVTDGPDCGMGLRGTSAAGEAKCVARMTIEPAAATLDQGKTFKLALKFADEAGAELAVATADVSFASSAPAIASTTLDGTVTGNKGGSPDIFMEAPEWAAS